MKTKKRWKRKAGVEDCWKTGQLMVFDRLHIGVKKGSIIVMSAANEKADSIEEYEILLTEDICVLPEGNPKGRIIRKIGDSPL